MKEINGGVLTACNNAYDAVAYLMSFSLLTLLTSNINYRLLCNYKMKKV
jgi:hypothetical protein